MNNQVIVLVVGQQRKRGQLIGLAQLHCSNVD